MSWKKIYLKDLKMESTVEKFKRGNVYIGRYIGFGAWYIIHQEGQRSWTACNFTHTNMTDDEDAGGDVIKGNLSMAQSFEKICIFDKENVEDRKNMRETMFKILKWGDPEGEQGGEDESEQNQDEEVDEDDDEIPDPDGDEWDDELDAPDTNGNEDEEVGAEETLGANEGEYGTDEPDDEGEDGSDGTLGETGDTSLPAITNADVERQYNFILNNAGDAWAVQNRVTNRWLRPNGDEVTQYRTFGVSKDKAYELIKQKLEKESE